MKSFAECAKAVETRENHRTHDLTYEKFLKTMEVRLESVRQLMHGKPYYGAPAADLWPRAWTGCQMFSNLELATMARNAVIEQYGPPKSQKVRKFAD